MGKPAASGEQYYIQKGLRTKRSLERVDSEAGRLAAYIIDRMPEGYDVYEDRDINERHLAAAVVSACGRYIRYCPQTGWMVYSAGEGRWTERGAEPAVQEVIAHFGELLFEGANEMDPQETRFARRVLSSGGITAIKNILSRDAAVAVEQDAFDADMDALNCMGAYYNLRAGETRESEPEDMFTKTALCRPAALEKAVGRRAATGAWAMPEVPKRFAEFMDRITGKDGEARRDLSFYLMSWFGYCLTGDNGASFFVNFHGGGANGKSELLKLMMELFGDYAAPLPKDVVIENPFAGQFDLAGLPGVRLGVLIDAPAGRLNMDLLKPLISGDPVNAKRKYLKDFTFKPVCKIAVGSNPKLDLKDTGMAVRRRVRMAPFDYTFPEEEQVPFYHRALLREEAPEILALLIWFAHEYYRQGEGPKAFPACAAVDEAGAAYMASQDLVGRWKEERTEAAEGAETGADELYKDFVKWIEGEGIRKKMQKNTFGDHLVTHVPGKKRKKDGIYYLGVRLKAMPLSGDPGG